ncbi:MAG: mechanosensitive ion channel family protein [Solirubrobacterales bacterium]|nr:mechanosensitive ion channel family protein [Solirubrobacterales bacterium]
MFETRSEAWERAGLSIDVSQQSVRRARGEVMAALPVLVAVLIVYSNRKSIFGAWAQGNDWIKWGTVVLLLLLGWTLARAFGRAAGPTIFRRMDPATAGTVGFLIRLLTMAVTLLIALGVAGVSTGSLIAGGAFTAIVLGLAAQQTLGNLFAGLVLVTARPFRVGERVRLQAGAIGGIHEGVVSSLGLMYTTLARGADRIMIPNLQVIAAVVVPIVEPSPVDVRVRLGVDIRPSQVQAILDDQIRTPTRTRATVVLEEIDPDALVIRVQATPERAEDGAQLADEIIATLASITGQHEMVRQDDNGTGAQEGDGSGDRDGDGKAGGDGASRAGQPTPGLRPAASASPGNSVRTTSSGR